MSAKPTPYPVCKGSGGVVIRRTTRPIMRCPRCDGTGKIERKP